MRRLIQCALPQHPKYLPTRGIVSPEVKVISTFQEVQGPISAPQLSKTSLTNYKGIPVVVFFIGEFIILIVGSRQKEYMIFVLPWNRVLAILSNFRAKIAKENFEILHNN